MIPPAHNDSGRCDNRGFYSERRSRTPDPLSGLKVRESGIFRTFAPNFFSLQSGRMRLLTGCSYSPCESFASTLKFRNGWRKMLLRIYGRVLRSQKRGVIPAGHVTHRWKGLFELVPTRPRWRRCDEKWLSWRSPCFYYFHVSDTIEFSCIRPAINVVVHSLHGAAVLSFGRH